MQITEQLSRQILSQNAVKHLKWSILQKRQGEVGGRRGEGFMELGHFNKDFVKNTKKETPVSKPFGVFSPRYS